MSKIIKIGEWTFDPVTGVLSQEGQAERRLEHRAASLLELLCRHHAELVLHKDIIEQVWDGRSISANSVAVVIADIRRALGDDARNPNYIETLPKRGYRMIAPAVFDTAQAAPAARSSARRWAGWGLVIFCAVMLAIVAMSFDRKESVQGKRTIVILPVDNRTDNPDYDVLSKALSELAVTEIMRTGGFAVTPEKDAEYIFMPRLIIWNEQTALSLRAQSTKDQSVVWSGMASGPQARLPRQVRREIEEFTAALENH